MAVTENEAVDVLGVQDVFAVGPEPFVFRRLKGGVFLAALGTAVLGEEIRQRDAEVRMHPAESPLEQGGSEDLFDALVAVVSRAEPVTRAVLPASGCVQTGTPSPPPTWRDWPVT